MNQKRNLILFIACSLDGYIATKEDSLDWLFKVEGDGDNGYTEFYEMVDTVIMGKRTYDWIMSQMPEFPYAGKECYVFTRSDIPHTKDVQFVKGDLVAFTNQLKAKDGKKIWIVGGGDLLHSFIKEKLVDEFIITLAPVILGEGIPLFREDKYKLDLSLKGMRRWGEFAELHYKLKKQRRP